MFSKGNWNDVLDLAGDVIAQLQTDKQPGKGTETKADICNMLQMVRYLIKWSSLRKNVLFTLLLNLLLSTN